MRRFAKGLVALCVLGVIGVLGGACGTSEGEYTLDYPGAPCDRGYAKCSSDEDCWSGLVHENETECIDQVCQCPNAGEVICNAKGHPVGSNMRGCRPPSDCEPGEVCQPEAPLPLPPPESEPEPEPEPECTPEDLSKCPGPPPDKPCGALTCIEGVCGVAITPGPIASQKAGDCKRSICDFTGKVLEEEDPSDHYDDGAECTFDICLDGSYEALNILKVICPDTGEGFCSDGGCVQCVDHDDCNSMEICISDRCILTTCANGMQDGIESDVDCGGDCLRCFTDSTCTSDTDCRSKVCSNGQCQGPTCDDNEENDGETDKDCGAACKDPAKLCGEGRGCKLGDDCASGVCWAGRCQAPTCTDGVQNDTETGVDCGGVCEEC